ncbi:MAG: GAF domain-containing protein, partial [Cyanobacteria bacterium J06597_16]
MSQRAPTPVKNLEDLLHRMTDRIRQSLELPEILEATADEMRRFLKTDRVKVYRFHEDGSGEVVAESIKHQQLPSLLGQRFPAADIPAEARELFLTARQRSIVNVARREIGISPLLNEETKETLLGRINFRTVDACHVEYLTAMGVQASLVVPILHHHRLWGLLVAHHSVPKRFGNRELEIVQLIADQVSVAIAHASLLTLTRLQGQHESVINQTVSHLHSTVKNPLKRALGQMATALQCTGGRLYIPIGSLSGNQSLQAQLVTVGKQPAAPKKPLSHNSLANKQSKGQPVILERFFDWRTWLKAESSHQIVANLWTISDVKHSNMPSGMLMALARSQIRSILVAKLIHQNHFLGYLSLFRKATDIETIWAGRLEATDPRQQRPRQSFDAWREIKKEQANPWTPRDIGLAQDLADRFASMIYQTQLYQKVQSLNADLEQRVAQRTLQLQIANKDLKREIAEKERTLKDLQEARDSLKRISHQNELILNAAGEGIYGIDPKGKVVFVNPAAAKILGCQKQTIIGHFMHDVIGHTKPNGEVYSWEQSPIFHTIRHGKTHHVTGDLFVR